MSRCAILAASLLAVPAGAQTLIHDLPGGSTGDAFGYRAVLLGDVDLDGHDDFAVSVPGWNGNVGRVVLYSGATATSIGDVQGTAAGDLFGLSLTALGDLDNDSIGDFAAGAPQVAPRGSGFVEPAVGAGYARVFSGATLATIRTHSGGSLGDAFGASVHGGLDADGDGTADLVVGAPDGSFAELRSGASGALLRTIASFGPETGYTVLLAPDLDGDGLADPVVSMMQAFSGFSTQVRAFGGVSGVHLWTSFSGIGGELGWVMLATDDVNQDGTGDVILADREWGNSFGALGHGRLYWVSGASGFTLHEMGGPSPALGVAFGMALEHLGDLDGDGLRDLAIAAPGLYEWNAAAYPGQALRFTHGWTPQLVNSLPAPGQSETFGQALAAGFLDGDNLFDLIVGAPRDDGLQPESGRVRVYAYLTDPQVYCQSQANSQGCVPHVFWNGTPSAALSTFRVHADDVLNQKVGLLIWGPQPNDMPFGDGTLCVGPPVVRTAGQFSGGTVGPDDCTGSFAYQFTSAYLSSQGLVSGSVVCSQYWSRDPAATSAFHLTDAVHFSVLP